MTRDNAMLMWRNARDYRRRLIARDWRGMRSEPRDPDGEAVMQRRLMRRYARQYAAARQSDLV